MKQATLLEFRCAGVTDNHAARSTSEIGRSDRDVSGGSRPLLGRGNALSLGLVTRQASQRAKVSALGRMKGPTATPVTELIPNWSSEKLKKFVEDITALVEGMADEWKQPSFVNLAQFEAVLNTCL